MTLLPSILGNSVQYNLESVEETPDYIILSSFKLAQVLNRKLANSVSGSLECACSMAPQLDSHHHN